MVILWPHEKLNCDSIFVNVCMPLKDLSTRVVSHKEEKWPSIKVPPPTDTYAHIKSEVFFPLKSGSEPVIVRLEYYWNIRVCGNVTLCRWGYISGSFEGFKSVFLSLCETTAQ